jgi:hypothetical protein
MLSALTATRFASACAAALLERGAAFSRTIAMRRTRLQVSPLIAKNLGASRFDFAIKSSIIDPTEISVLNFWLVENLYLIASTRKA